VLSPLSDQQQRHGIAKLVGMRTPFNIVTPVIERKPTTKEMAASYLTRLYGKLPFALPSTDAHKQIKDRQDKIAAGFSRENAEPIAVRRRIQ
jgi:hypothetical protein